MKSIEETIDGLNKPSIPQKKYNKSVNAQIRREKAYLRMLKQLERIESGQEQCSDKNLKRIKKELATLKQRLYGQGFVKTTS